MWKQRDAADSVLTVLELLPKVQKETHLVTTENSGKSITEKVFFQAKPCALRFVENTSTADRTSRWQSAKLAKIKRASVDLTKYP